MELLQYLGNEYLLIFYLMLRLVWCCIHSICYKRWLVHTNVFHWCIFISIFTDLCTIILYDILKRGVITFSSMLDVLDVSTGFIQLYLIFYVHFGVSELQMGFQNEAFFDIKLLFAGRFLKKCDKSWDLRTITYLRIVVRLEASRPPHI